MASFRKFHLGYGIEPASRLVLAGNRLAPIAACRGQVNGMIDRLGHKPYGTVDH